MYPIKRSHSYFKNAIQHFKNHNSIQPEKTLQISKICKHSLDEVLLSQYLAVLTEAYQIQETDNAHEKLKKILKFYQKQEKELKKEMNKLLQHIALKLARKVNHGTLSLKNAQDEFDQELEYLLNQFSKEMERSIQFKKVGELASREYFLMQTIANGQKPSDAKKLKNAMRKDFDEISKKNISLNFFKSQLLTNDAVKNIVDEQKNNEITDPEWQLVRSDNVRSIRGVPILGSYKLQQNDNSDLQVSLSDTTGIDEGLSESEQTESYSSAFEL